MVQSIRVTAMTFAFSIETAGQQTESRPDLRNFESQTLTLQHRVHQSIAAHTEFGPERILTQDNRVKYTNAGSAETATEHLDEVFQLMRQLNQFGVGSNDLGRLRDDGMSFKLALRQCLDLVVASLNGGSLVYVELGPEPVKTAFILSTLTELGVDIDRYVAVDINPMSAAPMRAALKQILPDLPMQFITAPFEAFRLADILEPGAPAALVTMLGFQEGNDDPYVVNKWLRSIARSGDLLLSESQLYAAGQIERIPSFYAHAAMRRFSRLAFERAVHKDLPSLNRFFLLPVPFHDGESAFVAILGEEFEDTINGRILHVSNFCLKLTLEQYRHYRQLGGYFDITGETMTDDQTLHFQLSRRV